MNRLSWGEPRPEGPRRGRWTPEEIAYLKDWYGLRDIETRIRITGGNILHGEILPEKMFEGRPVPGYSGYRTPIENLCWVG